MGEGGSRGLVLRVLPPIFPQGSDPPAGCWWIQVKIRLFIWQWYMKPQKIRIKTRMPRVIWYAQTRFALMNYSMLSRHTYTDIPCKGTWYNPTISWSSWSWSISWPSSWSIRRGGSGPLHVSRGSSGNPLHEAWLEAGQQVWGYEDMNHFYDHDQAGYPLTEDMNGFQQEGVGRMDATIHNGQRWAGYHKVVMMEQKCK